MIQLVLAAILVIHGLVHLVGIASPWKVAAVGGIDVSEGFFGHIRVGERGARVLWLVWLLVAITYVVAGIAFWLGNDAAFVLTLLATPVSLAICFIGLPDTFIGFMLDVLILIALAWISLVGTVQGLP